MRDGLERAGRTEYPLVVVPGHATYYPRFGFREAGPYGIAAPFSVSDEAWMVYPLPAYDDGVRGEVIYPPAFEGV